MTITVVALVALAGCGGSTTVFNAYAWKTSSSDATTLTLIVITGPDDKVVEGELVSESDTDVVVAATVRVAGGSHTANGAFREVDVKLSKPIGTRRVLNRDGSEVPHQP